MIPHKSRILAVDDNEDIRNLLVFILEEQGFSVSSVADGATGLAEIRNEKPDLILLDVMMPGFSGFDILEAIRTDQDTRVRSIPVLMITANSSTEGINQDLELGATSYMVKPFRPATLVEKVRLILQPVELAQLNSPS